MKALPNQVLQCTDLVNRCFGTADLVVAGR